MHTYIRNSSHNHTWILTGIIEFVHHWKILHHGFCPGEGDYYLNCEYFVLLLSEWHQWWCIFTTLYFMPFVKLWLWWCLSTNRSSDDLKNMLGGAESKWKRHTVLSNDSGYSTTDGSERNGWQSGEVGWLLLVCEQRKIDVRVDTYGMVRHILDGHMLQLSAISWHFVYT